MEVSVRELKSRLSEYLRRVRAGEEVSVTLRGRVVARLTGTGEAGTDDPVARLRRAPGVTWPGRRTELPRRVRPERATGLSDAIREERDDARW